VPQAEAEQRRAMAIAHEQENIAKSMRTAPWFLGRGGDPPFAIAEAFRSGNLA